MSPNVDTPFCTYQNLESPVQWRYYLVYRKQFRIVNPRRRFGKDPKLEPKPNSPNPTKQVYVSFKRCTHPSWMHTPSQHASFKPPHLKVAYAISKRCTEPLKWRTQGWDISHKSLDFYTSLNQSCGEVDKGQLGFLNSGQNYPYPSFSYIYNPIPLFQKTKNSYKNPNRNYRKIALEPIGYISFLRFWLFSWVLEPRKRVSFSKG